MLGPTLGLAAAVLSARRGSAPPAGPQAPLAPYTDFKFLRGTGAVASHTHSFTIPGDIVDPVAIFAVGGLHSAANNTGLSLTWAGGALDTIEVFNASAGIATPITGCFGKRGVSAGAANLVIAESGSQLRVSFALMAVFPALQLHASAYLVDAVAHVFASANSNDVAGDLTLTEPAFCLSIAAIQGNGGGVATATGGYSSIFAGPLTGSSSTSTDVCVHVGVVRAPTAGALASNVNFPGTPDGRSRLVIPLRGRG